MMMMHDKIFALQNQVEENLHCKQGVTGRWRTCFIATRCGHKKVMFTIDTQFQHVQNGHFTFLVSVNGALFQQSPDLNLGLLSQLYGYAHSKTEHRKL